MILKIGHRGAMGYEPENTLGSFAKAIELGVDMVEMDIFKCKTGQLVIIHDHTVDRTTDGEGYVCDLSFDALRSFDAGNGQKIPTLEEVLDLLDRRVKVNLELKGEGTAGSTAKVIQKYVKKKKWSFSDFYVSSFNHNLLQEFINTNLNVSICLLIAGIPQGFAEFAKKISAYSINVAAEFVNKGIVEDAHSRDMKVFVWVANEYNEIERMKLLGVDGIFSNYPDRL